MRYCNSLVQLVPDSTQHLSTTRTKFDFGTKTTLGTHNIRFGHNPVQQISTNSRFHVTKHVASTLLPKKITYVRISADNRNTTCAM